MLLELLAGRMECQKVCDVARESLKKVAGNVQAYYWLIMALNHIGTVDQARSEMENYRQLVTEEEYKEFCDRISSTTIDRNDCKG